MLKANMLNPNMGQKVDFQTMSYGFTAADISDVQRDFGDGKKESNALLALSHSFAERGAKVVIQTITLKNGKKLTNFITVYVVDTSLMLSYVLQTSPSILNPDMLQNISYTSSLKGDGIQNYITFLQSYDGNNTLQFNNAKFPIYGNFTYNKWGIYYPESTLYINECLYVQNQSTLAVAGVDRCLDAKLDGTLGSFTCDLDKDMIPDVCDDDIDGDGVKNPLWIIKYENGKCLPYTGALTKDNTDLALLGLSYQFSCTLDNAPFLPNANQLDLNRDGYGDVGTSNVWDLLWQNEWWEKDADRDSIVDSLDLCPDIKESYNNNADYDWCPEIWSELSCEGKWIQTVQDILDTVPLVSAGECNQCPCPLADITADLTNNDMLKAVLRDKKKEIPYRYSLPFLFEF